MFTSTTKNIATLFIFTFVLASAAAASSFETICADATTIDADSSTWRADFDNVQIFSLDVESAGILVVDVTTVSGAEPPRLIFFGRGCAEPATSQDFVAVEQGASYQVIAAREPGIYSFQVASGGIDRSLGEYQLRSSFVPTEIVEEEVALELGRGRRLLAYQTHFLVDQPLLKSDEEAVDPNPDSRPSAGRYGLKSDEEAVDPNPDSLAFGSGPSPLLSLVSLTTAPRQKSDEEAVDPNPDSRPSAGRYGLKSDEEAVDPNPDSRPSAGRYGLKSDEEAVDPNPDSRPSARAGTVIARLTLFPGDSPQSEAHESRAGLLKELAKMLESDLTR